MEELKTAITKAAEKVLIAVIEKAVNSFTNRVRKVENLKGNYLIKK